MEAPAEQPSDGSRNSADMQRGLYRAYFHCSFGVFTGWDNRQSQEWCLAFPMLRLCFLLLDC